MTKKTPIAVVGMAGIFPGASSTADFWTNIESGHSAIVEVPEGRWATDPLKTVSQTVEPDRTLSRRAGLILDFHFDGKGLDIAPDLALRLDPMYHLVLSAGRDALLDGRVREETKKRTGVILAAIALPTDGSSHLTREILGRTFEASLFGPGVHQGRPSLSKEECLAGRVTSLPAALVAQALGLKGGTYTLDAACSSSLYSIKLACDELSSGRADLMLAGGVSRPESLFTQAGFTQLKALSPSGVCAPFDASADGLVVGEGAGFIVLKRLDDALKNNDRIYALIHGSGLSNDIGGNLLAPDTEGQVRAMKLAYAATGWSPYDVDHIECHGTGTPVGDAIELKSLKTVWGDNNWTPGQCAIGSVKSMVGHLLTGAGIAGAIKTLLALHHKTLPPSLNFTAPSKGSPLENGPFRIERKAMEWPRRTNNPRRAALSAFGFGGINAHVLVEDFEPDYSKTYAVPAALPTPPPVQVAVVGLGTLLGPVKNTLEYQNLLLEGSPMAQANATSRRFRGAEHAAAEHTCGRVPAQGRYIEEFDVFMGEFHIPPNEIPDILPQHLLMLKASAQALDDAGIPKREDRPRMGAAIGMAFDYEAANFHLRWNLERQTEAWNHDYHLNLDENRKRTWLESLKNAVHPPLTATRTTGALGGIIASRVAKEFRLGGPCFIVSSEESSGLTALEIGVRSIENGETDLYLVGAVDLPGEIRAQVVAERIKGQALSPCEGAVAVVLKRLDQAVADNDRIYAVVSGMGKACDGGITFPCPTENACVRSLEQTFGEVGIPPESVGMIELCGETPEIEHLERAAIERYFTEHQQDPAVVKTMKTHVTSRLTGYTGSVQGLASFITACVCVYQGVRPEPSGALAFSAEKKHRALVSSVTSDGNACHALVESFGDREMSGRSSLEPRIRPVVFEPGKGIRVIVGGKILEAPALPADFPSIRFAPAPASIMTGPSDLTELMNRVIRNYALTNARTAEAHTAFLDFSSAMAKTFADTLSVQAELVLQAEGAVDPVLLSSLLSVAPDMDPEPACPTPAITDVPVSETPSPLAPAGPEPAFSRDMCMEFAIGSIGKVLGPMFDIVDTYKVRVRLPDEPLMLVDRIMSVTGEKGSLKSGKVITEHDVFPGAWYLDGNRCPVCISIEAGQADLFLCSYLGIDLAVKGKRSYRLLDAVAKFHGGLPKPGDVIRYEIEIDRFINQGETYLFFFHFNGFIGDRHIISMRKGCAGFFTEKEVKDSGGIILTAEETAKIPGTLTPSWKDLVPYFGTGETYSLSDDQVNALRRGDLGAAFGDGPFAGKTLSPSLRIPGGRMKLVDRVLEIDPAGGRYGLGSIKAQADIHPDDWFLTCHFVDDKVMPGTLMYECCMHTLRILLYRMGWVTDQPEVCCEPVPEVASILKCRGPVTVETTHVFYVVDIKEIGYMPEPYVIADAHMHAHDQHIVMFRDMSMKLSGVTQADIERYWGK